MFRGGIKKKEGAAFGHDNQAGTTAGSAMFCVVWRPQHSLLVLAVSSTYLYYVHVKINLQNLFSRFSDPTTAPHQSVFPVSFSKPRITLASHPFLLDRDWRRKGWLFFLLFPLGDHFFENVVHFRGTAVQTAAVWKRTANNVSKHVNTTKRKLL